MATKGKRPMRALTPSDKIEAIQRVNDGESKASVARDIGVPESTLRGWCKNEDKLRYMSSRLSSPDTDKSNDAEPREKRARTDSPVAPLSPATLDLSATAAVAAATPVAEAPVELTTRRPSPPAACAPNPAPTVPPAPRRPDPGASVSMSAISPLSGLAHLPSLTHSHLGLSFNEIATNLTLLAQLNPALSTLSAQSASRALRSVRSPKPSHNGLLALGDGTKHRSSKAHHSSDPYRHAAAKAGHHHAASNAAQPVDDTLWYWLKTQQAMLDLTAQTTSAQLQLGKVSEPPPPPKPVAPAPSVNAHLDYNRNSWLWQYYKQFGGAIPTHEEKPKTHAQLPREKTAENILYSHLTKNKSEEERVIESSPVRTESARGHEAREVREEPKPIAPSASPDRARTEARENGAPGAGESRPGNAKARTVLDGLLYSGAHEAEPGALPVAASLEAAEALAHGDKFLAWLEASGDPSVTRVHLHQLRALLHNLRARRPPSHAHSLLAR